jgi:NAD(P)H-dependent flavin oxidoreductase YrpB (nitropropane dioxygenase family)
VTVTASNPLGSALPLAAAPMAGGGTTTALARAVVDAGAFAFLAAGYKTPEAMAAEIAALRGNGDAFGVNLFAPTIAPIDEAAFRRYARELQPEADVYGLDLSEVPLREDDDRWADKLDLLLAEPVPVVSVTFGLPRAAEVRALQRAGSRVLVTATTVDEARAGVEAGADGLVVQGSDAGAHSGTHDPHRAVTPIATADLVRTVAAATALPVVAAGGVGGTGDAARLLEAGAGAVAVGTLLLRTDECGVSRTHKDALADAAFAETVVTRAFTGRPARGLRNRFVERHEATAPVGYPAVHHLTRDLRRAAADAGDVHRLHLWAGTGYRNARTGSARAVVETLAAGL